MPMYDDKRWRAREREIFIRSHPIRVKLLALYEQDKQRSLKPEALLHDLERLTPAVVAYHLRVLQDAGLLPKTD